MTNATNTTIPGSPEPKSGACARKLEPGGFGVYLLCSKKYTTVETLSIRTYIYHPSIYFVHSLAFTTFPSHVPLAAGERNEKLRRMHLKAQCFVHEDLPRCVHQMFLHTKELTYEKCGPKFVDSLIWA